jgi:hypothetical protein
MTVRAGTLPAICLLLVDAHAPPMHAQDTRSDTVVWTGIILEGIPHNIYTWRFERRRGTYEEDGSRRRADHRAVRATAGKLGLNRSSRETRRRVTQADLDSIASSAERRDGQGDSRPGRDRPACRAGV